MKGKKEEEIEEQVEETKEEVSEEVKEKQEEVKEEAKEVVKEVQEKDKDSNKGLLIFAIVGLLIVIPLAVFIGFKIASNDKKEEPKTEEKEEKKEEKKPQEVEITSSKVKEAMDVFDKLAINATTLFSSHFDIDDISEEDLINTTLNQLPANKIGFCGDFMFKDTGKVTLDELNEHLKEVIQDKKLTMDLIKKYATEYDSYYKVYTTNTDFYYFIGLKGDTIYIGSNVCEGFDPSEIVYKRVIKAEELDDLLYVYEKRAFYEASYETKDVKYYKDPAHGNLIETKDAEIMNEMFTDYLKQPEEITWDSYNTYKYTFKLVDGTYYFMSSEIVK